MNIVLKLGNGKIKWSEHDTERRQQQRQAAQQKKKRTLINSININCVIKNLFIKLNKQMELNQEHSVYKQEEHKFCT